MPKEMQETQAKQGQQQILLHKSGNLANTLADPAILKTLELAMEEMVRFEMTADQSIYVSQVKKIYEFKEYL